MHLKYCHLPASLFDELIVLKTYCNLGAKLGVDLRYSGTTFFRCGLFLKQFKMYACFKHQGTVDVLSPPGALLCSCLQGWGHRRAVVPQGACGDSWLCCAVPVVPGHRSDVCQCRAVQAGTGDVFLQYKRPSCA